MKEQKNMNVIDQPQEMYQLLPVNASYCLWSESNNVEFYESAMLI